MKTVNISLTSEQAKMVDKSSKTYGFANRSEFVRALLRLVKTDESILKNAAITPFTTPHNIPTIPEIKKKIVPILQKNDVEFAGIFGSYSRGDAKPESDLDILIRYKIGSKKSLLDLIGLEEELQDLTKTKVDVVTENSVHPYIIEPIKKDLIILYGQGPNL